MNHRISHKMNIAFLSLGSLKNPRESARITLLLLARELMRRGHSVTVFARKAAGQPPQPPYEMIEGVPVHHVSPLWHLPWVVRKFQRKGKAFEVIHSFSATPLFAFSGFFSKIKNETKVIHTLKSYSKKKRWNIYEILRIADQITVPTKIYAEKLRELSKLSLSRITIINSPIDTIKFQPRDKSFLKEKYGYANKKVIFYYGGMWKEKGIDILLRAFPMLLKGHFNHFNHFNHPNHHNNFNHLDNCNPLNVKLLIAPRYPQIKPQQELAAELRLNSAVEFILDDIPIEEYVAMADAVVLPYLNLLGTEGNPSCLLEALASKTPVVASDLPELREIAAGCILFSRPNDIVSLAERVHEALTAFSPSMVENAFRVSRKFDVEKIADDFIKIYTK